VFANHRERAPNQRFNFEGFGINVFSETGGDALLSKLNAFEEPLLGILSAVFPDGKPPNAKLGPEKFRTLHLQRNQAQKDFLDQWMDTDSDSRGPIDGLISPIAVAPAPPLRQDPALMYSGYTLFGNVLGKISIAHAINHS
jgi:amidase